METESTALLRQLFAFQTQDEFVYRHKWRVGDVLMWDNIATIHIATGGYTDAEHRLMHRTQVPGDGTRHRAANPTAASTAPPVKRNGHAWLGRGRFGPLHHDELQTVGK